MAKCIIGGTEYTVPELNFVGLEKAWPYIEAAMTTQDPMKGPSAGLSVIAAGIVYDESFDPKKFNIPEEDNATEDEVFDFVTQYLKRKLKSSEIKNVINCLHDIQEEAGLIPDEDPPAPPPGTGEENPSTETAANTSLNSSQPELKEVAGKP